MTGSETSEQGLRNERRMWPMNKSVVDGKGTKYLIKEVVMRKGSLVSVLSKYDTPDL